MGLLSWIIFGALAGWVASIIIGSNDRQGCLMNIIVGIVGAFIGGLLMSFLGQEEFTFDFNLPSFLVAVLGSVILLAIVGAGRRRR